jgi:hypothetical protein
LVLLHLATKRITVCVAKVDVGAGGRSVAAHGDEGDAVELVLRTDAEDVFPPRRGLETWDHLDRVPIVHEHDGSRPRAPRSRVRRVRR